MKKNIIIFIMCVFIVAPAAAYGASLISKKDAENQITNITEPTKDEFLSAARAFNEDIKGIDSIKKVEKWWYLVNVKVPNIDNDDYYLSTVVFYKFKENDKPTVAIMQNGDSTEVNITPGSALPYEIFDTYSTEGSKS